MNDLFSPYALHGLELGNRLVVPPMCMYSSPDGLPVAWHHMHYGSLVVSGAGLVILEATAVDPIGRISAHDLGLWSDTMVQPYRDFVAGVKSLCQTPLAIQLAHAGRKGSRFRPWEGDKPLPSNLGGWQVIGPSARHYDPVSPIPVAMDLDAIDRVVQAFASAAHRAHQAGFDAIELHMAHGYLLHEFLSPISNVREDEFGGSLENRMRLPLMVFDAVRASVPPDMPVGVRISGSDWVEGGWDVEDSVAFTRQLGQRGTAYIHVSGGGLSPNQKLRVGPGYQVGMAAHIRNQTGVPTIAVGMITDARQAQTILETGQADLVAVGRAMLFDPRWPWHAALRLGKTITAPSPYLRCEPHPVKGLLT